VLGAAWTSARRVERTARGHRAFVRVDEVGVRVAVSVWEADE
jgi:hypothetical protein